MTGPEVGELALHGVDEEADDEASVLGFLGDDAAREDNDRMWMAPF